MTEETKNNIMSIGCLASKKKLSKLTESQYKEKVIEVAFKIVNFKNNNPRVRLVFGFYQPSGVKDLFGCPEIVGGVAEGRKKFMIDVDDTVIRMKKFMKEFPLRDVYKFFTK